MRIAASIAVVGALVFLAHLFTLLFSRTRIPDVLWLLLIGVAIGPAAHLVSPATFGAVGPTFTSITLVLILLESGLSLRWHRLRRALPGTMAVTSASFVGEAVVVTAAALFLAHLDAATSILLGCIVAGNSPTVIVPLAKGLGVENTTRDILFLESALGDVLSIVLALMLLDLRANGSSHWMATLSHFGLGFAAALVVGAAGGLAWSLILKRTRALENALFTTPAFVMVLYGGAELLHANGAIAALAFGIMLGNIDRAPLASTALAAAAGLNRAEETFLGEIVFLLKTFFFVYIGLSVRFSDRGWLLFGGLLSLLLVAARIPAVRFTLRRHISARDAGFAACMVPKGLAAAVLAELLGQLKVPGAEAVQSIVYSIIFFGVVVTSVLVFLVAQPTGGRAMAWLLSTKQPAKEASISAVS